MKIISNRCIALSFGAVTIGITPFVHAAPLQEGFFDDGVISLVYNATDGSLGIEHWNDFGGHHWLGATFNLRSVSGLFAPPFVSASVSGIIVNSGSHLRGAVEFYDSEVATVGDPGYLPTSLDLPFLDLPFLLEDLGNSTVRPYFVDSDDSLRPFDLIYVTGDTASNEPPVAQISGAYTVDHGDPLTIDGSGSYDPDTQDGIVFYEWDLDGDGIPDFTKTAADGSSPGLLELTPEQVIQYFPQVGDYQIALTVVGGNPVFAGGIFGGFSQEDDSRNLRSDPAFATVTVSTIPEPTTAAIGLLSAAGLVVLRRRHA